VEMLKQKILTILGFVMITALVITIFAAYSYADPVGRGTETQEYEGRHNHHHPEDHYERHHHGEEVYNDPEEFYRHHHDEIEEDRYYRHCCH